MTRDEIIRMARLAGFAVCEGQLIGTLLNLHHAMTMAHNAAVDSAIALCQDESLAQRIKTELKR